MTILDIKHLDHRLREISDPFGTGFPILRKVVAEAAEKHKMPVVKIVCEYVAWKWRK